MPWSVQRIKARRFDALIKHPMHRCTHPTSGGRGVRKPAVVRPRKPQPRCDNPAFEIECRLPAYPPPCAPCTARGSHSRLAESARFVRYYPAELPVLADLLHWIQTRADHPGATATRQASVGSKSKGHAWL